MSIYRGAGGAGDAVADSSSEALLIQQLVIEAQADADAAQASATAAAGSASAAATSATNAANSAASIDVSLFARKANNLSDLTSASTARTNLGVAIGTNVQAWDADLDTWATKTAPSGTVVGTSDTQTLTTKTIALGSNTVSGTLAQFNTAVTDADLVSIAGAETLTNKTLTSPVVTGGSINNTPIGATTATTGAFTTSSLKGSTSGVITLAAAAVAGTNTATLPAATGTVMVSGNMPAFSATLSGSQTISNNTHTKIQFNTEIFDTNSNYDPTTNYRFTPTVAGYYQLNLLVCLTVTDGRQYFYQPAIFKNGGSTVITQTGWLANAGGRASVSVDTIISMNGTSDYLEFYIYTYDYTALTTTQVITSSIVSASLVRAA